MRETFLWSSSAVFSLVLCLSEMITYLFTPAVPILSGLKCDIEKYNLNGY